MSDYDDCPARRLEDDFAGDCNGCGEPAYFCTCFGPAPARQEPTS